MFHPLKRFDGEVGTAAVEIVYEYDQRLAVSLFQGKYLHAFSESFQRRAVFLVRDHEVVTARFFPAGQFLDAFDDRPRGGMGGRDDFLEAFVQLVSLGFYLFQRWRIFRSLPADFRDQRSERLVAEVAFPCVERHAAKAPLREMGLQHPYENGLSVSPFRVDGQGEGPPALPDQVRQHQAVTFPVERVVCVGIFRVDFKRPDVERYGHSGNYTAFFAAGGFRGAGGSFRGRVVAPS